MKPDVIVEVTQGLLAGMVVGTEMVYFLAHALLTATPLPPNELSMLTLGVLCFYFGRSVFMGRDSLDLALLKRIATLEQAENNRQGGIDDRQP